MRRARERRAREGTCGGLRDAEGLAEAAKMLIRFGPSDSAPPSPPLSTGSESIHRSRAHRDPLRPPARGRELGRAPCRGVNPGAKLWELRRMSPDPRCHDYREAPSWPTRPTSPRPGASSGDPLARVEYLLGREVEPPADAMISVKCPRLRDEIEGVCSSGSPPPGSRRARAPRPRVIDRARAEKDSSKSWNDPPRTCTSSLMKPHGQARLGRLSTGRDHAARLRRLEHSAMISGRATPAARLPGAVCSRTGP